MVGDEGMERWTLGWEWLGYFLVEWLIQCEREAEWSHHPLTLLVISGTTSPILKNGSCVRAVFLLYKMLEDFSNLLISERERNSGVGELGGVHLLPWSFANIFITPSHNQRCSLSNLGRVTMNLDPRLEQCPQPILSGLAENFLPQQIENSVPANKEEMSKDVKLSKPWKEMAKSRSIM